MPFDDRWYPRLCGDCKSFVKDGQRGMETKGAQPGVCIALHSDVTRTDWCHDPGEQLMHRAAMAACKYNTKEDDNGQK